MRISNLDVQSGNTTSISSDWSTFAASRPTGGVFNTSVTLSCGWYFIEVRALINGNPSAQGGIKVGVGDVFIAAGQSNAQGVTSTPTYNESPYDGVVADLHTEDCSTDIPQFPQMLSLYSGYPIATQGPTNWAYTVMGNRLAAQTGCPVAVFNTARFGTTVNNWDESRNGHATYSVYAPSPLICNQNGMPYTGLKNALNFYSSLFGIRAVLWHQGEADNQQSTTASDYQTRLNNVIGQTRTDFNYGLSWYIARATYNPEVRAFGRTVWQEVINGQNSVASANKYGPATDNLGIPRNGDPNEVHFGGTQLKDLGEAWQASNLVTANPVTANSSPATIAVALNGGNYTLTAQPPSGFTQIYWVTSNGKLSSNFSTASSITVSGSNNSYRYYARNGTGNIVVSAKVDIPLPSGSARIGVSESLDEAYNGYRLTVTPNPVSEQTIIKIRLPKPGRVLLDIVDEQGRVVKTVADASLDAGLYDYSFDAGQIVPGTYVCRLRADDFFLSKKIVRASE